MLFEDALRSYLITQGFSFGQNVFIEEAPGPNELDLSSQVYAVIKTVSESPIYYHPLSPLDRGTVITRDENWQLNIVADNWRDAAEAADAVRANLSGYRGPMEAMDIKACIYVATNYLRDPDIRDREMVVEFHFLYQDPT